MDECPCRVLMTDLARSPVIRSVPCRSRRGAVSQMTAGVAAPSRYRRVGECPRCSRGVAVLTDSPVVCRMVRCSCRSAISQMTTGVAAPSRYCRVGECPRRILVAVFTRRAEPFGSV